jgi:RNA polymerase sigma-70 factor (ECF subfamily)
MDEQAEVQVEVPPNAGASDDGFEAFLRVGYDRLVGALYLATGDAEEARDLAQEAYLRVWERWDRVRAMDDPEGYLFRTAMNLWRSRVRRAAVAARRLVRSGGSVDPFPSADDRDAVVRALRTLTPRQRMALVLTELLDYPSDEAARVMKVKPATVRALATQGRAALRDRQELRDG